MYGLLWTAFTLFLIFVYSVIWLEKIYLHLPLSFKVVWVYVLRLKGTVESFDLNYNWVLTGIIILIGIFISLFTLLSKSLLIEMIDFRRQIIPEANRYTINRPDRRWKIVALTLTMIVPLILLSLKSSPMTRLLNNMDPLVELAFAKDSIGNISNHVEPLSIREEYSNNKLLSKPNIILIMVDALRADYLPMYGYHQNTTPFLNQLYQEGKLDKIDYAFSASANSFHGILSTLRSKAAHKISFTNFSIQELLHDQGYRTHFIISGDHTYFYGLKLLYGVSVDYYFDGTTAKAYSVNDDQLIFEGLNPLPSYPLKPSFFYLHLMSAHQLWKKIS